MAEKLRIEGVPQGYKLDRFGKPTVGEIFLGADGVLHAWGMCESCGYSFNFIPTHLAILKRIEQGGCRVWRAEFSLPADFGTPVSVPVRLQDSDGVEFSVIPSASSIIGARDEPRQESVNQAKED